MDIESRMQELLSINENETPRQQHYRIQFLHDKQPLSIKKFYEKMKNMQSECKVDVKNSYTLPSFGTFTNWSVENLWIESKKEYQALQNRKIAIILQQEAIKDELEFFRTNQDIKRKCLEKAKEILELPLSSEKPNVKTYSGYHLYNTMQGMKVASEENRLVSGNPTEVIHSMNSHDVKTGLDAHKSVFERVDELKEYLDSVYFDSSNDVDNKSPDE